ncbi:YbaN family protein [Paraferrimonas sedimenticola]|uniref:Inner membrane protein n=1 Tax=Paraferrimonas sedimenticola TaxID=375674 RepID=A0AA37RYB8_9GAMM|nr:YbaN family protein [Paraferrimonas sedimenticola]GLP96907.1 inner membrane protein [Paraferrimonas sedimenticola]
MIKRSFYLVGGLLSLALGTLGVVLPLLPTVPFILLAAFCFARSSQRLNDWLHEHPWFAQALKDWEEKRAVNARLKKRAFVVVLLSFSLSIAVVPLMWVKIMLACMCCGLLWYLYRLPETD